MPRDVSWGTPDRARGYAPLRRKWTFLGPSLAVGGALAAALLLAHALGGRGSLSPGALVSPHASFESRCEECHTPRRGVVDTRCQRCHDASGAGRLTNAAHVLFGSRDAKKAAAAAVVGCARCHVDHRGRALPLSRVDEAECRSCHFRSFGAHPEFALLRAAAPAEAPGIKFSHERHVREVVKQGGTQKDSCVRCHEPAAKGDIEPIAFDRHCASCHAKSGSLGIVEPVPELDAVAPAELLARGGGNVQAAEFDVARGRIAKTVLRHRDAWVLASLARLRGELDPEGLAAERAALRSREAQLQRRLALAAPLAGLDLAALREREASLAAELDGLERRLAAQAQAGSSAFALDRVREVATAAASADASAQPEAQALARQAEALRSPEAPAEALPTGELDLRRKELVALLDAVEAADPGMKPRAEDLRRRLLSLSAGDTPLALLTRVREQRAAEVARVRDEIELRGSGVAPPPFSLLAGEQRAVRDALASVEERLARLPDPARPIEPLSQEALRRKRESLGVLGAACFKCHTLAGVAFAPLSVARPRLVRASFVHQPHLLQAECARCHAGIEDSKQSTDLSVKGVESCRECHRPRSVRADCQVCHRYHPAATP